jgi:hypothetical protein
LPQSKETNKGKNISDEMAISNEMAEDFCIWILYSVNHTVCSHTENSTAIAVITKLQNYTIEYISGVIYAFADMSEPNKVFF